MRLSFIPVVFLSISLVGCNIASDVMSEVNARLSGHINEEILKNNRSGEKHDDVKEIYLSALLKNYNDLKAMGDPNIVEIEDYLNKILADDYMSMYEYNKASMLIHKHKVKINNKNSNHSVSVQKLKKEIENVD